MFDFSLNFYYQHVCIILQNIKYLFQKIHDGYIIISYQYDIVNVWRIICLLFSGLFFILFYLCILWKKLQQKVITSFLYKIIYFVVVACLGALFWKIISILQSLILKNWIHPCYIFLVFVYILLTCTLWLMILVLVSCPADTFWNRL